MLDRRTQTCGVLIAVMLITTWTGCGAAYKPLVRPTPNVSILSPELENLTDNVIETYLRADVRPVFPTVLAVAKLSLASPYYRARGAAPQLAVLRGDEAEGWRRLTEEGEGEGPQLLEQVQFLNPMLVDGAPTLKSLRNGAALLHAPLLLVYMQDDDARQGYNAAAMAYWTIIGLFIVPGHTVGHHTVCQGVLVDTRSGFILATVDGEAKYEEHVLPGAVGIAADRVERKAHAQAVAKTQENFSVTLTGLASQPTGQR